jgi:ATP-dependent protease HslVU (ClpYQ) ATPase subunit
MYIWKKATTVALKERTKTSKVNKCCRQEINGEKNFFLGPTETKEGKRKKKGIADVHVHLCWW